MKNKLFGNRLARYILAGALSYALELSFLIGLHKLAGLSVEVSTAVAFWIGLVTAFLLQKLFAFKDFQKTVRTISKQLAAYAALVLFNYIFTLAVVAVFPSRLILVSRTVALAITTIWNFFFYRHLFDTKQTWRLRAPGRKNLLFGLLISLPVLLFFYQYLSSGNKLLVGDFDYYAQIYQAFRITVLHFHQWPAWNPWISGGVPLFSNPQFGLFSIQSVFVLIFGTIYGLKLAYIVYALSGFWGMYALCRRVLGSSVVRSVLVSYIWIFCGFFAGHNISHYTFSLFFLLPWLIYFIARRERPLSWLWLGLVESLIILSSVHYAFLMMSLVAVIFFLLTLFKYRAKLIAVPVVSQRDIIFAARAILVVLVLAGYRLVTTYLFVAHNQRPEAVINEPSTPLGVLLDGLFVPIGTLFSAPHTRYGWGEYSMYIGIGSDLAVIFVVLSSLVALIKKRKITKFPLAIVVSILLIGCLAFAFGFGDFARFSPFHLLHKLPGFTQTRVSPRWLIMSVFALLSLLAAWPRHKWVVNTLLFLSVVELFLTFGPPRLTGSNEVSLPAKSFAPSFRQYDNDRKHLDAAANPMNSYYFTTSQNIGQIYSDDSIIDTLDGVLGTSKCGYNDHPSCGFVMSGNARLVSWSPNKIELERTSGGPIELDMNVDAGWRINNIYPFASVQRLNPQQRFVLPAGRSHYELIYAPKLSPNWLRWRLNKI